ncbi:MAG: hypothetical protein PHQ43_00005 [Dehalococcoidales bacterium]|nr:hypothetical protein [Dehalococcoidales bacterium]
MTDQARKNSQKSDSQLAWDFLNDEFTRQVNEPGAILSRMAGGEKPRMQHADWEDYHIGCWSN